MTTQLFVERDRCPCCASRTLTKRYECGFDKSPIKEYLEGFYTPQGGVEFDYLHGAVYCLLQCGECGLIFQRDIPSDGLMERLYEHWIDPSKALSLALESDSLTSRCFNAQEIIQVIAYLNQKPCSLRFLDFGMGWGEWALMAKGFGCDVYGAELSKARIDHATSKGIKILTGKESPAPRFDFINTEQVFEHLPSPLETLVALKNQLKPGGLLKISVPSGWDIERRLRIMDWGCPKGTKNSLNLVAPLEHINCFQVRSIEKMASLAGLKPVNIPLQIQCGFIVNCGGPARLGLHLAKQFYRATSKKRCRLFLAVA
jgi:SAM-dependent methyltransferase